MITTFLLLLFLPEEQLSARAFHWQELQFRASKWGITANATMTYTLSDKNALIVWEHQLSRKQTTTQIFCDPVNLDVKRILKDVRAKRWRKSYQKDYAFDASGATLKRLSPGKGQDTMSTWSKEEHFEYPKPKDSLQLPIYDSGALLYLLGLIDWKGEGQEQQLFCFFSDQFGKVRLKSEGWAELESAIIVDGQIPQRKNYKVLKIAISVVEEGKLQLLGLKGDVIVYFEPLQKLPLRIEGKAQFVGSLNVDLVEIRTVK